MSFEREALYLDQLKQAMEARNSGGIVLVQVSSKQSTPLLGWCRGWLQWAEPGDGGAQQRRHRASAGGERSWLSPISAALRQTRLLNNQAMAARNSGGIVLVRALRVAHVQQRNPE